MTAAELKKLREPFKPEQIGKLPRISCKSCSDKKGGSPSDRHCDRHTVTKCDVCGAYITTAHIHLDFVGHALVTDRLLDVDPGYEFGPVLDANKLPITRGAEVLHYLTIGGATRYEWGEGPNMKEISSDAIRRCAMRFGVALDLWAKEPLTVEADAPQVAAPPSTRTPSRSRSGSRTKLRASQVALLQASKDAGVDDKLRHRIIYMLTSGTTESVHDLDDQSCDQIKAQIVLFGENIEGNMKVLEQWEAKR